MTKVQLTQTQILELIYREIEKYNYQNAKNFALDVIDEIKKKNNQAHDYICSKESLDEINVKFEIDKYYKHESRKIIHILGRVNTTSYGQCLVAETSSGDLEPIGDQHEDATIGWTKIDKNEWIENFS